MFPDICGPIAKLSCCLGLCGSDKDYSVAERARDRRSEMGGAKNVDQRKGPDIRAVVHNTAEFFLGSSS